MDLLVLQIYVMNVTIIASIYFIGGFRVFKKLSYNNAELANESVLLLISYSAFIFSDFIDDAKEKYRLGYVFCFFILFHLLVNTFFIFSRSIKVTKRHYQIYKTKNKAKKIIF